jgi:hypothetical protein
VTPPSMASGAGHVLVGPARPRQIQEAAKRSYAYRPSGHGVGASFFPVISRGRRSTMAAPKNPVPPRAYELRNTPIPFSRGTWFRWEKTRVIPPLLRLGGKTLVPAETIEAILTGQIQLPHNAGRLKPPKTRRRSKPEAPAQAAE